MNKLSPSLIDQILCCDCVDGMRRLPSNFIDMTLTSPPYGNIRDYGGQPFTYETFQEIARELYRITKSGGIVVWVVRDQFVKRKGATGDSARQWLYFREVGFRLHDQIPMERQGQRWPGRNRYSQSLEYAFVVSKGRPGFVDLIRDRQNLHAGRVQAFMRRARNGEREIAGKPQVFNEVGVRGPVWRYKVGRNTTTKDYDALRAHPALMPEQMATDHIVSWSRPGELVFDPLAGGGTTCKMAMLNDRHYLGFEVHAPYHLEALRRLQRARKEYGVRLDDWFADARLEDRLGSLARRGQRYDIIYADPPWPYKARSPHPRVPSVGRNYRTLSMEDIKSLPVGRLAARDSVLFLWTTGPFLRHAVEVVEAWGFTHKTVGFTWVKTNAGDGHLRMGVGFQTRANTEICLLATRGRGLHRVRNDINQVVLAPIGGHSEKPEEVRCRIESLYGPQRRIELFARKRAEGWDAVGDEIDGRDIRQVLAGA